MATQRELHKRMEDQTHDALDEAFARLDKSNKSIAGDTKPKKAQEKSSGQPKSKGVKAT